MAEYDAIAQGYLKNLSKKRCFMYDPVFFDFLGNIQGKNVLDLACGDGYYSRPIKQRGANIVIGVDLSPVMIELARKQEEKQGLGISYLCSDVRALPFIGRFDLITGTFLLHYSRTKEDLFKMCQNAFRNLRPGGRFVALNNNSRHPLQPWKKYGVLVERIKKRSLEEGDPMRVIFLKDGKKSVSFINYYWSEETYRKVLERVGFKDIEFHDARVLESKLDEDGRAYWKEYLNEPGVMLISCFRPK